LTGGSGGSIKKKIENINHFIMYTQPTVYCYEVAELFMSSGEGAVTSKYPCELGHMDCYHFHQICREVFDNWLLAS
jgi:hypothetical protein